MAGFSGAQAIKGIRALHATYPPDKPRAAVFILAYPLHCGEVRARAVPGGGAEKRDGSGVSDRESSFLGGCAALHRPDVQARLHAARRDQTLGRRPQEDVLLQVRAERAPPRHAREEVAADAQTRFGARRHAYPLVIYEPDMTASDRAAIREAAAPYPVFFQRIVMDEARSRDESARKGIAR